MSKKYNNSNLVGFFNYKILSSLKDSLINKIKWYLGNNLKLKYFSIYKSFGVDEIFKPIISDKISNTAKKEFFILKNQIKTKKDILEIKIKMWKLVILYMIHLLSLKKPTIHLDNNFFNFLYDFLKLYFFWDNYFQNNNVKSIIGVHSVYSYAIPLRIAMNKTFPPTV